MFIEVTGPMGHREEPTAVDNQNLSLGALLGERADSIEACFINGRVVTDWKPWVGQRGDKVHFIINASGPLAFLIPFIIKAIVMIALAAITYALTPKPNKPKLDSKRAESFGIAGYNNTTGPGTPRFVPYGLNRIHGHMISAGIKLSDDGRSMLGRVLYSMGDTGGDQVQSISDVLLDLTAAEQFEGMQVITRLGDDNQSIIPEFENVDTPFSPGLPTMELSVSQIYTTKSNTVNRATLFFNFVSGLYRINGRGATRSGSIHIKIEYKKTSESTWTEAPGSQVNYVDTTTSGMFKTFQIDFPTADKYDIRVEKTSDNHVGDEPFFGDVLLFNVQETHFTTRNYGGDALLALVNIPAKKVRSLEALRVSALVEGKRVKVWDGSTHVLQYTRQRCWIVRDMMTHTRVGMGYEFTDDEIDDDQWKESQDYYDEQVEGHDGNENRGYCDFVLGSSQWDWDWVKKVAGEGRGRLIPSGDKWKYLIDRPGDPDMLYTEGKGGNIIEDSIVAEIGPPDRDFHQIIGEFRNAFDDYNPDISPPISDPDIDTYPSIIQEVVQYETITRESEVDRENMIILKRAKLEKRRWQWTSPASAIVSEPMDLSWFGERVMGDDGAYSGFLPSGSTTTKILLQEPAVLEPDFEYSIIVKHKDNTVEQRTIATPAGKWIEVEVTSAFGEAPKEHDIFLLGKTNIDHIITRAQDLEIDNEGRVKQTRTEYIPAVYTPDPLPPRQDRKNFKFALLPPIPLRDAQVQEEIAANRDGSHRSVLIFDVTPGLARHGGLVANAGATTIDFYPVEPNLDDYFKSAMVRIIADDTNPAAVGQQRKITSYAGSARQGTVAAWDSIPTPGVAQYEIEWDRFGDYEACKVEVSDDGVVGWSEIAIFFGTHFERDGREQAGTRWFRFTPLGPNQIPNIIARIVRQVTLIGDTSAPEPPIGVFIGSVGKNVTVEIHLRKPTAEDLSGVVIEFYRNTIGGQHIKTVGPIGASQDNAPSGTMVVRPTVTFDGENYDTLVICRAQTVDYSGNSSAFVDAPNGTVLKRVATGDIDPEAVTTISEYVNDASTGLNTDLALLTVPNSGFSFKLEFKATMVNLESSGMADVTYQLRRGSTVTGLLLDSARVAIPGQGVGTVYLLARDTPGAGVHTYNVSRIESTAFTTTTSSRKMLISEVKR